MYLVFAGDTYYPGGGWDDYVGEYATQDEARKAAKAKGADWWHIVHGGVIVEQS